MSAREMDSPAMTAELGAMLRGDTLDKLRHARGRLVRQLANPGHSRNHARMRKVIAMIDAEVASRDEH